GLTAGNFGVTDHGTAAYEIPIIAPPGRRGLEPHLSFAYESVRRNGLMGMSWKIAGLSSIHRCPHTFALDGKAGTVTGTSSDALCLDGERLDLVSKTGNYGDPNTEYRTHLDTFAKILLVGPTTDSSG